MPLISALKDAIENMPDSMKVDSLRNFFKRQGVKDAEIDNSRILDHGYHVQVNDTDPQLSPENGKLTREQLLAREAERPDVTDVQASKDFSWYTLPSTNLSTYTARVYTNAPIAKGQTVGNHFDIPNYYMHTRSDIINKDDITLRSFANFTKKEVDSLYSIYKTDDAVAERLKKVYPGFDNKSLVEWKAQKSELDNPDNTRSIAHISLDNGTIEPTNGDKALRIQEIQSDLANNAIGDNNSLVQSAESIGHTLFNNASSLSDYIERIISSDPSVSNKTISAELRISEDHVSALRDFNTIQKDLELQGKTHESVQKDVYTHHLMVNFGLNKESADKAYSDFIAGRPVHLENDISNLKSVDSDDLFEDALHYYSLNKKPDDRGDIPQGVRVDFEDNILDNVENYLVGKLGLSNPQAQKIADNIEQGELVDFQKILNEQSQKSFDYPYVKQALYHEIDNAQQQGIKEIQIAIKPEGVKGLARSAGVQKDHYEGTVLNTAQKVAKQIGATVEMKKGYLVMALPAAAVSMPLYAQSGLQEDKNQSFVQTAVDQGYSQQDAQDTLFKKQAKAAGYSDDEINQFMQQRAASKTGAPVATDSATAAASNAGASSAASPTGAPPDQSAQTPQQTMQQASAGPNQDAFHAAPTDSSGVAQLASQIGNIAPKVSRDDVNKQLVDFMNAGPDATKNNPVAAAQLGKNILSQFSNVVPFIAQRGQEADLAQKVESARSYVSDLKTSFSVVRPYLDISSKWDTDQQLRVHMYDAQLADNVQRVAAEHGIQLTWKDGKYLIPDQQGNLVDATPDMMQDMYGDKFQYSGAGIGATLGRIGAGAVVGMMDMPKTPWFMALGAIGGAAIGSMTGSELDYMNAAISTRQNLNGRIAYEKAIGAAQASITYDVLFGSSALALKGISKVSGAVWNTLTNGYNLVKDNNKTGAYSMLKTALDMNDDDIKNEIDIWERVNQMPVPLKEGSTDIRDKALTILPTTASGGHEILSQVATRNPKASSAIRREVNQRAQTLLAESSNIADEDASKRVLASLRNYVDDTKMYLDATKQEFANNTSIELGTPIDYAPQIDSTFQTIMDHVKIDDNTIQFLTDRMARLKDRAANLVEPGDLLDMRTSVTSLKYSRSITNTRALNKIDELLGAVDSHIESVAKNSLGEADGQDWLDNWEEALRSYSHMLTVEQNGLFNAVTKFTTAGKAVTGQSVADSFVRYGPSIDEAFLRRGGQPVNTYEEVMDVLPISTVRDAEGLIVQNLTDKFTAGRESGLRATDFPALSQALSVYPFRTTEAQRVQTVVNELGKLYKNDINISRVTGGLSAESFKTYMAADPVARAHMAVTSEVFNFAQQMKGGSKADTLALVKHVSSFLNDPLNPKTTSHLIDAVKEDQGLKSAMDEYQRNIAQVGENGAPQVAKVKLYSDGTDYYLKPGAGLKQVDSIPAKGVAREDYARNVIGIKDFDNISKFDRTRMIQNGFEAIMLKSGQIIKLL